MLHTTLRQMVSISGRTILAIGLSVGAMTAFTSAVKAQVITVTNPPVSSVAFSPATVPNLTGANIGAKTTVGGLTVSSNAPNGYDVKVASTNGGLLTNTSPTGPDVTVAYVFYAASAATNTTLESGADAAGAGAGLTLVAATPTIFATVTAGGAADTASKVIDIKISQASTAGDANNFTKLAAGAYTDTLTFTLVDK